MRAQTKRELIFALAEEEEKYRELTIFLYDFHRDVYNDYYENFKNEKYKLKTSPYYKKWLQIIERKKTK